MDFAPGGLKVDGHGNGSSKGAAGFMDGDAGACSVHQTRTTHRTNTRRLRGIHERPPLVSSRREYLGDSIWSRLHFETATAIGDVDFPLASAARGGNLN